jgi:hypothetical protein
LAHIGVQASSHVHFLLLGHKVWMASCVASHDEPGQHLVEDRIDGILDHAEYVEPRQNGLGELDVLAEGDCRIVPPSNGVGCCHNGAAGLQGRHDAGL